MAAALLTLAPVARAGVAPPITIDGPSAAVASLGGVALAEDATGGVVYLKTAAGQPHVFVSTLAAGVFSRPVQVDSGVGSGAATPLIAAADGGRLAVVWMSGGTLFGAAQNAGRQRFSAPQAIAPADSNPSLSMGISGTAYVSFTAVDGSGTDVRAARLDRTSTSFVPLAAPLNQSPAGLAGSGQLLRSRVAVAADAIGIVTWAENGGDGRTHVLARRVFGLDESAVTLDLTLDQLGGHAGSSADSPAVAAPDDSSYPWIAFRQAFDAGGGRATRVVARELVGSAPQAPQGVDGLGFPAGDSAQAPSIALDGGGDGLIASELNGSNQVIGAVTGDSGFGGGVRINQVADSIAPQPVVALGRHDQGIVAFAPDTGSIQARLYDAGSPGDEVQLSSNGLGPVDPGAGLSAATDAHGDQIVGFVQGTPGAMRIAVGAVVPPPGPFSALTTTRALRTSRPLLRWTAARDSWSGVVYTVYVDGLQVASTPHTSLLLRSALRSGTHQWRVVASDSVGQQSATALRPLRIAGRAQAKSKAKPKPKPKSRPRAKHAALR
jgi:hypothetical protein